MSGGAARAVPETDTGWTRRRAAVTQKIEAVALRLFARKGVENVTVGEIAVGAEISERTFFRYFTSREDILIALPARALARITAAVGGRPKGETILEAFKAALHSEEQTGEEQKLTLLWGRVVLRSPEAGQAAIARLHPNMTETFRKVISARLQRDGGDESTAGVLAAALGGIVGHVYVEWVVQGGKEPLAQVLEKAFDALAVLTGARSAHRL